MPLYAYKARNMKGDIEKGTLEGVQREVVYGILKEKGLYPMEIKEVKYDTSRLKFSISIGKKVSMVELYIFCKQFSIMINAGVPIVAALDVLIKQEENKTLKATLRKVAENVHKGFSLSESMKQYSNIFPNILISMIEVGELSGNLDKALEDVSEHFERENNMNGKIKTAMIYPLFILGVAIIAVIFMIIVVVPKFTKMFDAIGGELPKITQVVLGVADKLKEPLFISKIVFSILFVIFAVNKFKNSKEGGLIFDKLYFKIPLFKKEYKKIIAARFARTLGLLVASGVPIIQSLDVISSVIHNKVVEKEIDNVKDEIKSGSSIAKPIAAMNIFPKMVTQMISVGEETGTMETTVMKVAEFYDEEVDRAVKRLTALIEPMMILLIAVVVGIVVIAMIMPIFSLEEQLGTLL